MIHDKKSLLLLLVPFCIIIIFILKHAISYQYYQKSEKHITKITFPIEGYDPRSFLSGHYLQFIIRYNQQYYFQCSENHQEICGCLKKDYEIHNIFIYQITFPVFNCAEQTQECAMKIRMKCNQNRLIIPHTRYYIPEELSPFASSVPPNSYITLLLDSNGNTRIERIFVIDKKGNLISLEQFLMDLKNKK